MEPLSQFGKRTSVTKTEQTRWGKTLLLTTPEHRADRPSAGRGLPARRLPGNLLLRLYLPEDGLLFRNQRFQPKPRQAGHCRKLVLIKNPVLGSSL